jgi:ribonuclease HI
MEDLEFLKKTDDCLIYTDGACSGNPGPGGWGVVVKVGDKEFEFSGGHQDTTNNRMEMTAAIEGLKLVSSNAKVILRTDSKYLQDGITLWIKQWRKNGWLNASKQPVKNKDLWMALDGIVTEFTSLKWEWVKGHGTDALNNKADFLAKRGIIAARMKRP